MILLLAAFGSLPTPLLSHPQDPEKVVKIEKAFPCRDFLTRVEARLIGFPNAGPWDCCTTENYRDPLEKGILYLVPQHQWRIEHPDWYSECAVRIHIWVWDKAARAEEFRQRTEEGVVARAKWPGDKKLWAKMETLGTTKLYIEGDGDNVTLRFYLDVFQVAVHTGPPVPPRRAVSPTDSEEGAPKPHDLSATEVRGKKTAILVYEKLTGKRVPTAVELIRRARKGTYDLAGTAEDLAREVGREFVWTTKSGTDRSITGVQSFDDWDAVRELSCFEFVRYVAYNSSKQPTYVTEEKERPHADTHETKMATDKIVWDRKSEIPRGQVVFGVHRLPYNNKAGFYHVGISLGGGMVISLGSGEPGEQLRVEKAEDAFPAYAYSEVYYGDYNWGHLK